VVNYSTAVYIGIVAIAGFHRTSLRDTFSNALLNPHRPQLQRQSQHHFEASCMNAVIPYRTDQARNMHRFYRLDVQDGDDNGDPARCRL
jgi:hypothetical protein